MSLPSVIASWLTAVLEPSYISVPILDDQHIRFLSLFQVTNRRAFEPPCSGFLNRAATERAMSMPFEPIKKIPRGIAVGQVQVTVAIQVRGSHTVTILISASNQIFQKPQLFSVRGSGYPKLDAVDVQPRT